jgi:O-antigen/teichoic acid export membrane protein
MTFAREAGHSVRTQAYVFAVSFVIGILVARALGAHQRGVLSLAQQLFSVAVLVGGLGFDAGVRYHVAGRPGRKFEILAVGSALALASVVSTIGLYALGFIGFRTLLFGSVPTSVVLLFGLVIPLHVANAYLGAALYGDGHVIPMNQAQLLSTTTRLALISALLVVGLTIEGVILATMAMEVASLGCLVWHYRRRIGPFRIGFGVKQAPAILGYGVKSMGAGLVLWGNYRLDVFLVAAFSDAASVGRYSVAVLISEVLMKTSAATARPLFPRVARERFLPAVTAMASRGNLLLMLLLGPAILVPAYAAHLYLGREFAGMLGAFICLLPGTIATSVGYVVHSDLAGRGAVGKSFVSNAASLLANIGLNVVLIPRYGILGAAIASSFAYLLNAVVACGFFAAIHGLSPWELFVIRRSDVGEIRGRLRQFVGGLVGFK